MPFLPSATEMYQEQCRIAVLSIGYCGAASAPLISLIRPPHAKHTMIIPRRGIWVPYTYIDPIPRKTTGKTISSWQKW